MATRQPSLLVIAGPNGSGKSTLTNYLRGNGVDFGEYINPDEIAAELDLPPAAASARAQHIADFRRDMCLRTSRDFSFETVMSHPSKVAFMRAARMAGYDVTLFFVATSDPGINVARVENRVALGGHDVPHDRIRARYGRSMSLLHLAVLEAKRSVLFDNSALAAYPAELRLPRANQGLRPVAEVIVTGHRLGIAVEGNVPDWVAQFLLEPLRSGAWLEAGGTRIELTISQADGLL